MFQSLSRDSVCLDVVPECALSGHSKFQSLSRDSVCLDGMWWRKSHNLLHVSIPESGFCLFGRQPLAAHLALYRSFNP